jgi:CubicO group peptidase (beta-lactamase class C family)
MTRLQFRVLYREFLFRLIDLDGLAADALGGAGKLFGQFATILILIGISLALIAIVLVSAPMPPETQLIARWSAEHFLIETTMLVVGLFAVLSWDSTFPNRRDVFVLAPLPIRARTLFLSKIAAVATGLAVSVAALQFGAGLLMPIALTSQSPAQNAPSLEYDHAIPPVTAAEFEAVLNRDLGRTLSVSPFAPSIGNGLVIGVLKGDSRRIVTYGTAKPDSIFLLGSVSKTLTGLILAQMAVQGKVRLDEPVRNLLPPGVVNKPAGSEIALQDLATHHSGLPRTPYNLVREVQYDSDARYDAYALFTLMFRRGVGKAPRERFVYSNLGVGLLGIALANRAGMSYDDLLRKEVTGPLNLADTAVSLSPQQQSRMIRADDPRHRLLSPWEMNALAPASAINSTAGDMLTYLAANLHPEKFVNAGTLPAAIAESHEPRADAEGGAKIALNWMYSPETRAWWHSGAMAGYTSYAFFDPAHDAAAIVLCSGGPNAFGFTDTLGEHIRARLAGQPAISVNTVRIPASSGGIFDFIRIFAAYWLTMLSAGVFIFCCVLGAQGLAAQLLPRRLFLRISSFLQLAAFCVFVIVYFLEPKVMTPGVIAARPNYWYIEWSPTYWFLGLLQQATGSPALPALARRAWIGLAVSVLATAVAYSLAYLRTMKQIVEEPDIAPALGGWKWLPPFGGAFETAIGHFSFRTLVRSRQQRLMVAFYLGIGFAATILLVKALISGFEEDPVRLGLLGSTLLVMGLWVAGTRVAFSLPVDLGANWIFRLMPVRNPGQCQAATRRAFYAVSVVPMCAGSAVLLFRIWPWQAVVQHVFVLALIGIVMVDLCQLGTQKLPFTCSYLPGKSNFHISFLLCCWFAIALAMKAARIELLALEDPASYLSAIGVLSATALAARWWSLTVGKAAGDQVKFEESENPAVLALDLHRDGVTTLPGSANPQAGIHRR